MADKFEITYHLDDGYVGKDRPYYVSIGDGEINPDMTDAELSNLFFDTIHDHFVENHHPYSNEEEEFLEWARAKIAEQKAEEE